MGILTEKLFLIRLRKGNHELRSVVELDRLARTRSNFFPRTLKREQSNIP